MTKSNGQIRIIAGKWRNRRLPVHNAEGLRPTTDRQKETLFNWLQGVTDEAKVLDLYAGAGGLGFEAMSRYAQFLLAIEKDKKIAALLKKNAEVLSANAKIQTANVLEFLKQKPTGQFDLVFIDPPFRQNLLQPTLDLLAPWLAEKAWIYLEAEAELSAPQTPEDWLLYREKVIGQSHAYLFKKA